MGLLRSSQRHSNENKKRILKIPAAFTNTLLKFSIFEA
ncbi:hypothetical protein C8P67_104419 [Flavobacterium aquicola]|uniref:Uncharacterized protein n=1 Tax=Flavobacterium aquicola TaxID=1682742 RepID=A0A3E0ENF2_9FLAO|nr:hypothetical protein C8P67_104419 [Flavobacterium aquicola]